MSQIYEALSVARDRTIERLIGPSSENRHSNVLVPRRVIFSHRRIRNILVLAFFGIGLALLAGNYAFNSKEVWVNNRPLPSVAFQGTVHPSSESAVTADLAGTISSVSVKVGETVQMGQPLMSMDGREAQLALQQAEIELHAAQANLDKFRSDLEEANARVSLSQWEEQHVPSRQWRDSPERATAAYELAVTNYDRAKALYGAGVTSRQELDSRETELRIARDDMENAKKLAGITSKSEQDQATRVSLQSVVTRQELQQQLSQAQLKYQQAKGQAEQKVVRATQAGVVSDIPVHAGDHVSSGALLLRLAQLDTMVAEVPVAARMVAELKVGQTADVQVATIPPQHVQGTVRVISPLPSPNMTHLVEVEFGNPTLTLMVGQTAEVRFSKQ